MKKSILVIFLIVLVTFNVQTSFGYTITFEDWGNRIKEIPLVCILEPTLENDKYLTEIFVERLMKESLRSIGEWEAMLKHTERSHDKSMWEINQIIISLEEQKEFDYQECNVFIHFRDKPELEEDWFKIIGETKYEQGTTGRTEITVYYAGIRMCMTQDQIFIYFDPCYTDTHRIMPQIKTVIKHEFGHALGLGHYIADNLQVNIEWAQGQSKPPSIMAVFTHQNFNENIITLKDINKVITLYGVEGFLHSETVEKITFLSFESPIQEFIIIDDNFQIAQINGVINTEELVSGIPVVLEITRPDGTSVSENTAVDSDGVFKFQKIIYSSVASGTYFVTASYKGEKSNEISFNIIKNTENYDTTIIESQIPQWLKNNVKWYAEGQMMDRDFVLVIKYLIEKGLMDIPDWTEQTQNQEFEIPDWIKNNAKWWSENQISDDEFINGMQFLIENGIIKI